MSCRKVKPNDPEAPPPLLCPDLKPVSLAYENQWFKILNRGGYFTLEHERPQAVALPVIDGSSVAMVRVFRPVIGDAPLELPAGGSAPGETPREAARRELAEETGIRVDDLSRFKPLLPLSEMPGRMPVLLSVFRVDISRAEFEARSEHDSEISSVIELDYAQVVEKIVSGEIYLSSPLAILGRLLLEHLAAKGEFQRKGCR